jgi:Putative addiction module component
MSGEESTPPDAKQILESALALPAINRVAIVESLLPSLDHPDAVIDESWAAEAEERLAALQPVTVRFLKAARNCWKNA